MLKVEEVCSCGAALVIDEVQGQLRSVMDHITEFRRSHRHDPQPQQGRLAKAIGFQQYSGRDGEDEDEGRAR